MAEEQAKQFIDQATQSLQSGQVAQALELADQAVALSPNNAEAHLLRAIALSQSNQPQAATDAFRQSITLGPDSAKAYFNFAVHLYSQGQKVEASSMAQEAARLEPSHAGARDLILRIESESGVAPSNASPSAPVGGQTTTVQTAYPAGYAPPEHSLGFVPKLGGGWVGIGAVLAALDLAFILYFASVIIPLFSQFKGDQAGMQAASQHAIPQIVGLLFLGNKLGMLGWLILDIVDRRGNWIWIAPQVLCGSCSVCGFGFITMPIYLMAGRKKPSNP